jgi:hypothetical protein
MSPALSCDVFPSHAAGRVDRGVALPRGDAAVSPEPPPAGAGGRLLGRSGAALPKMIAEGPRTREERRGGRSLVSCCWEFTFRRDTPQTADFARVCEGQFVARGTGVELESMRRRVRYRRLERQVGTCLFCGRRGHGHCRILDPRSVKKAIISLISVRFTACPTGRVHDLLDTGSPPLTPCCFRRDRR